MCHQSVGLIARDLEQAGIPTLSMSSALSITRSVNPPRAAYLDYPLGHTTGKPDDPHLQKAILRDALKAFEELQQPGEIKVLNFEWDQDDSWKDRVMRADTSNQGSNPSDNPVENRVSGSHSDARVERFDTPQYQNERDQALGEANMAAGGCPTCVWLGDDDGKR